METRMFGTHKCAGGHPPDPCTFCHLMARAAVGAYGSIGDTANMRKVEALLEAWKEPAEERPAREMEADDGSYGDDRDTYGA